jgi:soluble lytic murein transglycosylase-like protein
MRLRVLVLAALAVVVSDVAEAKRRSQPARTPPDPGLVCRQAIRAVEREAGLPPGLLMAIARVETGRTDRRGNFTPWAWSLRANGRAEYLDTREEAVRRVAALRSAGVTVIDVGCVQVNLHYHDDAFPSVARALDPMANTRYAARFLKRLNDELGNWPAAVAAYHSRTPSRGHAYRDRVMAAWPGGPEAALVAMREEPLPLPPPEAPPLRVEVAEARD